MGGADSSTRQSLPTVSSAGSLTRANAAKRRVTSAAGAREGTRFGRHFSVGTAGVGRIVEVLTSWVSWPIIQQA